MPEVMALTGDHHDQVVCAGESQPCVTVRMLVHDVEQIKQNCVREDGKLDIIHRRIDMMMDRLLQSSIAIIVVLIASAISVIIAMH